MLIKRDLTYGKGKKAFPVQTIAFFDLPALLSTVALFDSHDSGGAKSYFNRTSNFTGASKTATIDALTNGAPAAAVAKSDKMLADFEQVIRVETSRFETVNAVAGGVANVPAFLAGHPMAMRQRRRVDSALGPLTVLVDVTTSAHISEETIERRGIAVLALIRALAAVRPIDLHLVFAARANDAEYEPRNVCFTVKLDSAPLDLGRACFALTNPAMQRRIGFAMGADMGAWMENDMIRWINDDFEKAPKVSADIAAEITGAINPLYLAPMYSERGDQPFATQARALAWVKDMIAQHGFADADSAAA
jgi:hypothetical protein